MASNDDRRSVPANNFLTPATHLHVEPNQLQHEQHLVNRLHEQERQSFDYPTEDRGSFTPISPYYQHNIAQRNDVTTQRYHQNNASLITPLTPLMVPPTRHIPTRSYSRNTVISHGSFANADLFQEVSSREQQLEDTLQDLTPFNDHYSQSIAIPTGDLADVESGMNQVPTVTPNHWNQTEVQTVTSQDRSTSIWPDDAITLFPSPSLESEVGSSQSPKISFSYDSSTDDDRKEFWTADCPTSMPLRLYFHCRGHRYRTPPNTNLKSVWRIEIQEGYAGAFQEWEFTLTPGWYEFECCDNPLVIIGKYNNIIHMFSYPLQRQNQFARQGILLPVAPSSHPSPCYLDAILCRRYRIGGFLHPSIYGVPGNHDELLKQSSRPYYLPMDVFHSEGVIACQSWAAAKSRAIVGSYFGNRGGTSNVIQNDTLQGLLSRVTTRRPYECTKPALVPYIARQLQLLGALDASDEGGDFTRPIPCYGIEAGSDTPMLFTYHPHHKKSFLWPPISSWPQPEPTTVRQPQYVNHSTPYTRPKHTSLIPVSEFATPAILPFPGGEGARSTNHTPALPDDDHSIRSHIPLEIPIREVIAKSPAADTVSIRSSTSSEDERRRSERRNDRMKDIPELPPGSLGARKWAEGLQWRLMTDDWNHDGQHAVDITTTTTANSRLSSDFLALILNSAMKHKTTTVQDAVQSKLSGCYAVCGPQPVSGVSNLTHALCCAICHTCLHHSEESHL